MNRRALLVLVGAALLVVTGSIALLGPAETGQSVPEEDVAAAFEELDSLTATQVSRIESGGTTNRSRARIRATFDGTGRQFSRVVEPDGRRGDLTVTNETVSIVYDASEAAVTRIPRTNSTASPLDRGDYYASVVAAARTNDTVSVPDGGVSPLPVFPSSSPRASVPTGDLTGYDVTYHGTDRVAGRTAHEFRLTARSEAALSVNRTLWLDAEYYYPLRRAQTTTLGTETYTVRTRLENVSFDADLPSDTFDWTPPANATVETLDVPRRTYDSRADVVAATRLSVPDPSPPEGYSFARGTVIEGNFTQVSLTYRGADGRLTVSKTRTDANRTGTGPGSRVGENVTVGGQNATYLTTAQSVLVSWSCAGAQYSVVATDLDREQLLAVAESIRCE
jgi:outer membrane lipoprotein-sorting protein